jgi:TonB-linked SusC/RagA family outer membrane protein
VIVVTTKKGKYNQSTRFNVSTDMAIQDVAYDKQDWMNAEEFVKWGTLLYYNAPSGGGEPGWGASGLTMDEARQAFIDFSGWDGQTDTDWFDAVQRNVSSVKTYNVSATGGSENTSFRVGFSYYDNNPLIITSKFDRISLNSAINHKIGDKFNMGLNLNYSNVTNKTYDDGGAYRNPWLNNWMLNPLVPIYDESDPTGYNMNNLGPGSSAGFNPVAIQKNDIMQGNIDTFVGSINAELQFAPGFYLYSLFGTQYQFLDEKQYWHNWLGDGLTYGGYLAKTHTQTFDWNWNSSVSYRKVLAEKHDIQFFVGMEYQEHWYDYFQAEAQQMLEDEPYLYWGTTDQEFLLRPYADYTEWKQLSYFSRLNYVFDGKYTLSGQLRRDGNSTLGNEKFGTFWSVAGAWDLDSENFIPETFNNLVLRANYGQIGNIPYADNYRAVYNNFTTVGIGTYGNDVTLGIAGFGDPNLIWEEAQQLNVGLDASFLNDNIGFSIDYYDKKTESLIFTGRIPTSTYGGGAITSNVGELLNKGIEFSINAKPYNKEFKWIINGNLSYNKGMVGDMYDPEEIQTGNELSFKGIKQGQMIGEYYLLGWAGVNPETGAPRWYTDETETETTEVLSEASPYFQGTSPFPKYIAGLRNEFIYKGVSLSVFFSGQFEYQVLNAWSHYVYNDGAYAYFNQTIGALEDSWSPDNPNASNPLQWNGNSSGSRAHSSRWLRDGDHIRLKEAKLAYSFGNRFKSQTGVDNLTIYVKGMNLWMYAFDEDLTFDPESNSNGRGSGFWGKGIYDYTSPLMRSVSLGVSIDF